jgi:hypothetical protein
MTKYKSELELATKIVKTDGSKVCIRVSVSLALSYPHQIIFGVQHTMLAKSYLRIAFKVIIFHGEIACFIKLKHDFFFQITNGFIAGGLTSSFNQPFDVVNTRLQVHMKKQTTMKVVKETYKENGFKGYYKGLGPRSVAFPMAPICSAMLFLVCSSNGKYLNITCIIIFTFIKGAYIYINWVGNPVDNVTPYPLYILLTP